MSLVLMSPVNIILLLGKVTSSVTALIKLEKEYQEILCRSCSRAFCDLRTDEDTIELALKMSMKGMSNEAIADV